MGFSRQEYWSGLPFPSPGNLPNRAIQFDSLASPETILYIQFLSFSFFNIPHPPLRHSASGSALPYLVIWWLWYPVSVRDFLCWVLDSWCPQVSASDCDPSCLIVMVPQVTVQHLPCLVSTFSHVWSFPLKQPACYLAPGDFLLGAQGGG